MWKITNNGVAPFVLHSKQRQPIVLAPGAVASVDLSDNTAARYGQVAQLEVRDADGRKPAAYVRVRPGRTAQAMAKDMAAPSPTGRVRRRISIREEGPPPPPPTRKEQAAEIRRAYEAHEISFPEASERASRLVGNAWPGSTPKKSVVWQLLGEVEDKPQE